MGVDDGLTAQMEPFDSFWEAPSDIEKGYASFKKFYQRNYFSNLKLNPSSRTLVISCGPGYFLEALREKGYENIFGIDSDASKVAHAQKRGLNCAVENAFSFLERNFEPYDLIVAEQEVNHLTKAELKTFMRLCFKNLNKGGSLVVHSLNGANPITGSEALSQNFDHYHTLTEYSLRQVLEFTGYQRIKVFPLNLYIFYENPLNAFGRIVDALLQIILRLGFIFYGKSNRIFTKKIGAIGYKD